MTDITAFPTTSNRICVYGKNRLPFIAAETLYAGMVVALDNDGKVVAANSADAKVPIGVVNDAASANGPVAVNTVGTVCYVANEDDTTAIGEGTTVCCTDTDGTVAALAGGADSDEYVVGLAITDIAADGWGLIMVRPYLSTTA